MKYRTAKHLEKLCDRVAFSGIPLGILSACFTPNEYDGTALITGGVISFVSFLISCYFDAVTRDYDAEFSDGKSGNHYYCPINNPSLRSDEMNFKKRHKKIRNN